MATAKLSPTAPTRWPLAAISIPELSMATWPCGSQRTAKISAGSAAIARSTSIRSLDGALMGTIVPRRPTGGASEAADCSGPAPATDAGHQSDEPQHQEHRGDDPQNVHREADAGEHEDEEKEKDEDEHA